MRDNKFNYRAWCEKLKSYAPLEGKISFSGNTVLEPVVISADGRVYSCNPYGGMEQCELDDMTDYFIIEQCTGLKDKNGKLIYEGDLVRLGSSSYTCSVVYQDGCFWLDYETALYKVCHKTEIIGNIHEVEVVK